MDIDLIKVVAIIGVVAIHTCSGGFQAPLMSFDWLSAVFWRCLTSASVPLFFMCSGATLLRPEKDLPIKRLYSKNMLRIVVALFAWALLYKLFHLMASGALSGAGLFQAVKELLLFNHEFHLYYLHIIIIVYAFFAHHQSLYQARLTGGADLRPWAVVPFWHTLPHGDTLLALHAADRYSCPMDAEHDLLCYRLWAFGLLFEREPPFYEVEPFTRAHWLRPCLWGDSVHVRPVRLAV